MKGGYREVSGFFYVVQQIIICSVFLVRGENEFFIIFILDDQVVMRDGFLKLCKLVVLSFNFSIFFYTFLVFKNLRYFQFQRILFVEKFNLCKIKCWIKYWYRLYIKQEDGYIFYGVFNGKK